MEITTSTAKVYHGGGRRWFTKKSAKRAEAWSILKKHCCDCDVTSSDYTGANWTSTCDLHKLRADYKATAIDKVLAFGEMPPVHHDEDLFAEVINEMVWSLWKDQKEEEDERLTIAGVGYTTKL